MKFYLLASIILASCTMHPQETPDQPTSRFTHASKALLYSLLTAGAVVATGCAGWAYYFHHASKEPVFPHTSRDYITTPPFDNEEYLSNKTLAYLIASGATVAYSGLKSVEHLNQARKQPSVIIDNGVQRLKHLLKSGYWVGATVGCYAISKELEKVITEQHVAPDFYARRFETQEAADQSYTRRIEALGTIGFIGAAAGCGFCAYKSVKEVELSLQARPTGVSLTARL